MMLLIWYRTLGLFTKSPMKKPHLSDGMSTRLVLMDGKGMPLGGLEGTIADLGVADHASSECRSSCLLDISAF